MDVERVLRHDFTILMARSDEGKTMYLADLIKQYKAKYNGDVHVFGVNKQVISKLGAIPFDSLLQLEKIQNSIIIADEIGTLFDLENRKYRKQVENILRLVNHNGNKIVASGLPSDFKKFLCAKAKCFIFKTLNITDMINGSLAKEILLQYKGNGVGVYSFQIAKNEALIYDGDYYTESVKYEKDFDTKKDNKNLFQKRGR